MRKELTLSELDGQQVELLPARETLFFNFNWANVYATNSSMALNAGTYFSHASSAALQSIVIRQH